MLFLSWKPTPMSTRGPALIERNGNDKLVDRNVGDWAMAFANRLESFRPRSCNRSVGGQCKPDTLYTTFYVNRTKIGFSRLRRASIRCCHASYHTMMIMTRSTTLKLTRKGRGSTKLVIFLSSSGEGHFETSVSPLSEDDVTQDADFIHGYPIAGCGLVFTSVLGPMHRLTVAVLLTWLVLPSGRLLPSLIRSLHPWRFVVRSFVLLPLSGEDQVCRHHSILQVNTITSGILSSGTGSTLTASCGKDSDQRHRRRISLWTTAKAVAILKSLHIAVSTIFYSNDSTIVNTILFQYTNYYEDNYPNKIKART